MDIQQQIKVIAFDADDTLWVNEPYFQEAEKQFCALLEDYLPSHQSSQALYQTELARLGLYGYGVKGFMLSMVETLCRVTEGHARLSAVEAVLGIGHELLQRPVELLEGIPEVLEQLKGRYRLVVATKGDLLDQERKLRLSGLQDYFHHIEIMSDKKEADYRKLLKHLDCGPECFLMLGNSLKSDVLPVLAIDAYAAHVPYHTTWQHERHEEAIEHPRFLQLQSLSDILQYL